MENVRYVSSMTQPPTALQQFAELAAGGLSTLAVIYDDAIRQVHDERQLSVQGRDNPNVLHSLIRERVILAGQSDARLVEAGLDLRTRESDSIRVAATGASIAPKVLHKPQHGAFVADEVLAQSDVGFWGEPGTPYIFYSIKDGALARLILVQVLTDDTRFAFRCEWMEEHVIYDHMHAAEGERPVKVNAPTLVLDPNDEDGLDDMVQRRNEESSNEVVSKNEDRDVEQGGELGAHSA